MTTISVALPDQLVDQLNQLAASENLSIDELIQLSSEEWVKRQSKFEAVAEDVLKKQSQLLQQLAEQELAEQRKQIRATLVSAGLSKPAPLHWPQKPRMSDDERLQYARNIQEGKSLSEIIIEEREGL